MTTHQAGEDKPDQRKTFVDKCVKGPNGRLALAAKPNLPIAVWALARVASWLLHGSAQNLANAVAFGALFTWAWLELFQGVNYFRRALGLVVLTLLLTSAVHAGTFAR